MGRKEDKKEAEKREAKVREGGREGEASRRRRGLCVAV